MIFTNGHIPVVFDVETTGLIPGKNEIIQIAALPLNKYLDIDRTKNPLDLSIKPERESDIDWDAFNVNTTDYAKLMSQGLDTAVASDIFVDWVNKLNLPDGKRIMPIAHNWPFDRDFIIEWLGRLTFNLYFDGRYRDTLPICQFINDRFSLASEEKVPFPKTNLSYIASQLNIDSTGAHDALADCYMTQRILQTVSNPGFFIK